MSTGRCHVVLLYVFSNLYGLVVMEELADYSEHLVNDLRLQGSLLNLPVLSEIVGNYFFSLGNIL